MHVQPSRAEFRALAAQGNLIPVYADLTADFDTPVSAFAKLRAGGREPAYLLESIEGGATLNRYSFLGCRPRAVIACGEETTTITNRDGSRRSFPTPADPLTVVENEMAPFRPVALPGMPRFVGGAVGLIGYEYIHRVEPTVPRPERDPLGTPVLHFLLTDTVVIFDRARQTIRLLHNAHLTPERVDAAYDEAVGVLNGLREALGRAEARAPDALPAPSAPPVPPSNRTRAEFESMVAATQEYIRAGDIIQVVLSQRFEVPFHRPPLDLYRALRTVNPSPYMFLYETPDFALVGASPEVHVRLTDGLAESRPIAGTRPRGKTVDDDLAFEKDLLADEKERAEHLMLVDLARNDLGRVCEYGTVTVPEYMVVERYSHVMHIVSQVEGRLAGARTAYDLVRATFPAGTVSGAPKVRAMQIIAELEGERRGPYAGVLAYFSYDGNLDSCIAIRTACLKDGRLTFQSGAGLVADSVPASEYQETVNKAAGMARAIALAQSL